MTGKPVADMLKRGVFYLPSDRRAEGLVLVCGARENIALGALDQPEFSNLLFLDGAARNVSGRESSPSGWISGHSISNSALNISPAATSRRR